MIPKHSNPFVVLNDTAIVSRSDLRDSDDEDEPIPTDSGHAQMLARLENILKRMIEDVLPPPSQMDGQWDGDVQRKKRRKVDKGQEDAKEVPEGDEEVATAVSFRLFSGSAQPKPIVLAPKVQPWIAPEGPALEDTAEEAERRASRAQKVAVDYTWLINQSTQLHVPPPGRPKGVVHLHTDVSHSGAPLLLLERTKPVPPNPPPIASSIPDADVEPSPHAHDASESCCPIVEVKASTPGTGTTEKRKRRGGKPRQRLPIQAMFWRPPPGLGGRALGYAWGYAGSRPLQPGESSHYTRDTMKKANYDSEEA